jgi:hypothetical protein
MRLKVFPPELCFLKLVVEDAYAEGPKGLCDLFNVCSVFPCERQCDIILPNEALHVMFSLATEFQADSNVRQQLCSLSLAYESPIEFAPNSVERWKIFHILPL